MGKARKPKAPTPAYRRGITIGKPRQPDVSFFEELFGDLGDDVRGLADITKEQVKQVEKIQSKKPMTLSQLTARDPATAKGMFARQKMMGAYMQDVYMQKGLQDLYQGAPVSAIDQAIIKRRTSSQLNAQMKYFPEGSLSFGETNEMTRQVTQEQAGGFFGGTPFERFKARAGQTGRNIGRAGVAGLAGGLGLGIITGGIEFGMQNLIPDPTMTDREREIAGIQTGAQMGGFGVGYLGAKAAGATGFGPLVIASFAAQAIGQAAARAFKEELAISGTTKERAMAFFGPVARAGLGEEISPEERRTIVGGIQWGATQEYDMSKKIAEDINELRSQKMIDSGFGGKSQLWWEKLEETVFGSGVSE